MGLINAMFGTPSARRIKKLMPIVKKINELEPEMQKLSDSELRAKPQSLKKGSKTARHWTMCSPKHLRRYERRQSEP